MTVYTLLISPVAQDDLKNIYRYSLLNWGKSRANGYLEKIQAQLWILTDPPEMGVDRDNILPVMRSLAVESHTVFYQTDNQQIKNCSYIA